MVVIQVSGFVGSGKKYLCSKLKKNIIYFDADAIYRKIANQIGLSSSLSNQEVTQLREKANIMFNDEIKKIINRESNKHEVIVFLTVDEYIRKADKRYYIKITNMNETYRRFCLREINNFIKKSTTIKNMIKKDKINKIYDNINAELDLRISFPIPYNDYVAENESSLHYAMSYKASVMSQSDIIKEINKLA